MIKYLSKALHLLTKKNLLIIVLFSAVYSFLNPTLAMLAGQATSRSSAEYYNVSVIVLAVIVLSIVTIIIEYIFTRKWTNAVISKRFLAANIFLLVISIVSLKTASSAESSTGTNGKQISEFVYYTALFMHIILIKVLSLLYPESKKKHA